MFKYDGLSELTSFPNLKPNRNGFFHFHLPATKTTAVRRRRGLDLMSLVSHSLIHDVQMFSLKSPQFCRWISYYAFYLLYAVNLSHYMTVVTSVTLPRLRTKTQFVEHLVSNGLQKLKGQLCISVYSN